MVDIVAVSDKKVDAVIYLVDLDTIYLYDCNVDIDIYLLGFSTSYTNSFYIGQWDNHMTMDYDNDTFNFNCYRY